MTNYGWGLDPQKQEEDTQKWVIPGIIPAGDGIADEWSDDQ